ncbi:hypothetical protein HYV70_01145 [Candidatus Uhrbacteria bacterium]|nr:hypothetical protein [Candidatus Uhrbacteria bacterium]
MCRPTWFLQFTVYQVGSHSRGIWEPREIEFELASLNEEEAIQEASAKWREFRGQYPWNGVSGREPPAKDPILLKKIPIKE